MNYACYNILSTIAILGPFGAHIRKRSTVYAGLGLGSGMLLVIALSVMSLPQRSGPRRNPMSFRCLPPRLGLALCRCMSMRCCCLLGCSAQRFQTQSHS